ncbi:MAG: hypothetical protein L6R42_007407 [Xanthoria sp. 1 TBL-2021]|nr:MAG: hypothetical protein L6R42_007407 [Xanthoria sp. 1 TBL-2021]
MVICDENEQILWKALQHELLGISLDKVFLHRHKKVVLRYVRAPQRRSGFSGSSEAPLTGGAETTKTVQNSSAKRRSLCTGDDAGGKRARTSGERSEDPRLFDAPETAHSKTKNGGIPFRFRDPRITFGPDFDDDLLADFVEQEDQPSLGHTLRNQMRDSYRTLYEDFEPKYEMTIFFESGQNRHDDKLIPGLIHEIETRVVMKLDNLELGQDATLRNLRKMIINEAQKMLDDLEKIKSK